MKQDRCSIKGCKGKVSVVLLNHNLCEECWEKHCDEVECKICGGQK